MNPVRATLWSMGQRYIPSLIHIIATLVITRMITPDDFGEVALVMTFCQIASLAVASGFGEGLMYRVNNSQAMFSSVFFFNVGVAVGLYLLLFACSDIIASFYAMPRLSILFKVACLNIIVYSLSYIQKTRKQMELDFKSLALISLIASLIGSAIGISLAYMDYGVWSIVLLTLSINVIEMLLLWFLSKWKPSLTFSWAELRTIIPYSSKILFNNFVQVFYDNIYSLVIGKFFNAKSLGYFNRMQTVVYYTTTNFMYSIEMVFFPLLCKRKDNRMELENAYEKLLRLSAFLAFPILVLLIGLSRPIVVLVLTEKWIEGAMVLQLIATAYLFVPIIYINNSFLKIMNRTDILFYSNTIKKIIGISILLITVFQGFNAVCYGVILYYGIDATISMFCTHRFLQISISHQLRLLCNSIILNMILFGVLFGVSTIGMGYWGTFLSGAIASIVVYYGISRLFGMREYELAHQILNQLIGRNA